MIAWLEQGLKNRLAYLKGSLLKLYLRHHGCQVGHHLKCREWPVFRVVPRGKIIIGDRVTIGYRITFDVAGGVLVLGDHVNLTQDIILSVTQEICIGDDTLVAENVSIRDSEHSRGAGTVMARQGVSSRPVRIGKDVWIGAGCRILRGSKIADGCVIGANSVVLEKSATKPDHIYVGCPVRMVGKRE
ncbi:MAG: acyltransferase [Magnetococcales bacterium]|nr:acyltransferase [Magnetococcales bacterium]